MSSSAPLRGQVRNWKDTARLFARDAAYWRKRAHRSERQARRLAVKAARRG